MALAMHHINRARPVSCYSIIELTEYSILSFFLSQNVIGRLYLLFEYYNSQGTLVDGDKCDFWDTCDVYFFICVRNAGSA